MLAEFSPACFYGDQLYYELFSLLVMTSKYGATSVSLEVWEVVRTMLLHLFV